MPNPTLDQQIIDDYNELGTIFTISQKSNDVTLKFINLYQLCQRKLAAASIVNLNAGAGTSEKNYIMFSLDDHISRPVNIDLYHRGLANTRIANGTEQPKIDIFWHNVQENRIANQLPEDITAVIYVIAISFCCCMDIIKGTGGRKIAGTYFERLVGHLYAKHLDTNPRNQMMACELDGVRIPIPTDYIFDLGAKRPKYHIPVKTTTRDRVVQVWAQQRLLDGAYGVGRFICLLTCISETEFVKNGLKVNEVCIPDQWLNYQLFIAQIKRAYYLDIPQRYAALNNEFPRIHVKSFGEFFHESGTLAE